jgi:hypothetical protein
MAAERWMLIRGSEEGNPITWLDDTDLEDLLDNPEDWRVASFADHVGLPDDPNYWSSKVGVLVRYEVVIPVPAGTYKLPEDI